MTSWGVGCAMDGVPGVYASIRDSLCFIKWAVQCNFGAIYDQFIDIGTCGEFIEEEIQDANETIQIIQQRIDAMNAVG